MERLGRCGCCGGCGYGRGFFGGCGGCGGFGGCGYGAAASPLYVVNQGPYYAGPGLMVPYPTYSPETAYAPATDYPYVSGYGNGYGYGYGAPVYRPYARPYARPYYHPRYAYRMPYRPHVYYGPRLYRPWRHY